MNPRGKTLGGTYQAYLKMCSNLSRARASVQAARRFKKAYSPAQRRKIREMIDAIWRELAWLEGAA